MLQLPTCLSKYLMLLKRFVQDFKPEEVGVHILHHKENKGLRLLTETITTSYHCPP